MFAVVDVSFFEGWDFVRVGNHIVRLRFLDMKIVREAIPLSIMSKKGSNWG